jgi:hypothetical protein
MKNSTLLTLLSTADIVYVEIAMKDEALVRSVAAKAMKPWHDKEKI